MSEMPIMFPMEPGMFWQQMKKVVQEVISELMSKQPATKQTGTAIQQPLLRLEDLQGIFRVSKPTLYKWIEDGRLRSFKIRNRRFFVREDIEALMQGKPLPLSPFFPSRASSD